MLTYGLFKVKKVDICDCIYYEVMDADVNYQFSCEQSFDVNM